ncbi:MAG: tRNA lysidine(34) synthetase TilS [Halofilum sp. (in: g-proteobacteria)]|nr:tRNA lysidine(34) synthetase TilS [Halofilum sp. (in: g-proteobacteria)]
MVGGEGGPEQDPAARLEAALARHAPDWRTLVVAFSGGPDSTLLLAAAARLAPKRRLRVIHVDHGWHPDSAAWARHCWRVAAGLGLRCELLQVDPEAAGGEGPEAAARRARYRSLADRVGSGDVLLTAHHRDDQAETLLLALLRGGGIHGWAGMPPARPFGAGGMHLRPWLGLARTRLREWHDHWGLESLSDPANEDPRYERAWLRQSVLPVLRERWPETEATLARAAGQAAEAADAIDALAARDFVACRGHYGDTLDCDALATLPEPRRRALLRWWIDRNGLPRPPAVRLTDLERQLRTARRDRNPCVRWPGGEVRRWRGEAWALAPRPPVQPGQEHVWPDPRWPLELPDRVLGPEALAALGVEIPSGADVRVRYRQGGERLRLPGMRQARPLKTLLSERGVPPWERDRVPLIFVDGELAAVIGLGRAVAND